MQQVWRDESRSRRPSAIEERLRHRSRSRSAAALSSSPSRPWLFYFPWRALFYKAFDAATFFLASSLTQSQPQNPLLALLPFIIAPVAVFSFLISRPSPSTLKSLLTRRRALTIILLAAILSARTLLLLAAVHPIGPSRALIATGSVFPLTGTLLISSARIPVSNAYPAPLLAGAGLILVGYDASESSAAHKAVRVLHKKMRRKIRKWRKKISRLTSDNVTVSHVGDENSNPDNNQIDIPVDDDSMRNIPEGSRFVTEELQRRTEQEAKLKKKRRRHLDEAEEVPKPLHLDEAPPQADGPGVESRSSSNGRHLSRKPLAVLDDDNSSSEIVKGNRDESSAGTGLKQDLLQSSLNGSSSGRTISASRPENKSSEMAAESIENHAEANGPRNDATSVTPERRDSRLVLVSIVFVLLACWLFEVSNGMLCALFSEIGDWSLVAFSVSAASLALQTPFVILSTVGLLPIEWTDLSSTSMSLPSVFRQAVAFGWCSFLVPLILICCNGSGKSFYSALTSSSRPTSRNRYSLVRSAIARLQFCTRNCFGLYLSVLAALPALHIVGTWLFGVSDELSVNSCFAFALMTISVWFEASRTRSVVDETRNNGWGLEYASRTTLSNMLGSIQLSVFQTLAAIRFGIFNAFIFLKAFIAQARSNKASWQVWNYFLLQAGMVLAESMYAMATKSTGLILVSADNIFCCIALGLGLHAIKLTASHPTDMYTYGMTRFESLCGFSNGILLVYIAVLVVLEAIGRHLDPGEMEYAHASIVCIVGIVGNLAGLVFFPPESRRENHNVQGIYLHIWGNTLAFVGVGASAVLTEYAPGRIWIGVGSSILVAGIVIVSAIPLIARSGRVLLLNPPPQKKKELAALQARIKQVHGVVNVSALRAWNLTPTCMVASVRISTAPLSNQQQDDILFKVRSLFASIGISASQATIQISSEDSSSLYVRGVHKRALSGAIVETPELEGLYIQREQREEI